MFVNWMLHKILFGFHINERIMFVTFFSRRIMKNILHQGIAEDPKYRKSTDKAFEKKNSHDVFLIIP